mgnify:CR=1 FL=1
MARRLGVRSSLTTKEGAYVPSLGLGAIAVSPLDLASAYATLAAGGIYSKPMAIRKVRARRTARRTPMPAGASRRERGMISPGVACDGDADPGGEHAVRHGDGRLLRRVRRRARPERPTTTPTRWFCGYTPNLEATVWIGYPRGEIPMLNVHGIAVSGPTFPATIWKTFMQRRSGGLHPVAFKVPSVLPTWHSFTRGQYAVGSYSPPPPTYYYSGGSSGTPPPTPPPPTPPPPPPPPGPTP